MRTFPPSRLARNLAAPLVAAGALAACGGDPLAPFQPEIANRTDTFELQATGLDGVTAQEEYAWTNAGTAANVNQATVLTGGSATLKIFDAGGTLLYSRDLTDNGTFPTAAGTSGTWTIRVELSGCRGDLNFRVETP